MATNIPIPTLSTLLPHPPKENLTSHFILGEIVEHLDLLTPQFPNVKTDLLKMHLWDIRNKNVDPEAHLRGFLKVFENTEVFQAEFGKLDERMKRMVGVFVAGGTPQQVMAASGQVDTFHIPPSPAAKHHLTEMVRALEKKAEGFFHHSPEKKSINEAFGSDQAKSKEALPQIFEDKEHLKIMQVYASTPFHNWGETVNNTPLFTFIPSTVLGLQNLVKWAKSQELRVRCSGYRHSWAGTFSQDRQVLISLLGIEEVTKLPDVMSISEEGNPEAGELKSIEVVEEVAGGEKALCRVGVSVTNEQFRRWAVKLGKWSLPVDVILVEVTIGGVNGPICHGAGLGHQTINDYVRAVEYVDCNGELQKITDPVQLKAAAGSFGLLGVVTHITFQLDKMSYALLRPTKPDIGLAIPPLSRDDIPIALRKTYTDAQYSSALQDFKHRVETEYYSEYFWFTHSQQAWVNTFSTSPSPADAIDYPDPFQTWCQWVQGWLGSIITRNPIFNAFPGRWQAEILSTMGMLNLPPFSFLDFSQSRGARIETIKTALPNALHFRRGVQNMVVRDMEFQIPIPGRRGASGQEEPDWDVVRRAWWDAINLVYDWEEEECPMRLTLEMRIMGGSGLTMAPQRGNKWGTCSIEVLSIPDAVTDGEWVGFLQRIGDLWMSYKDSEGNLLNVRPHWAKEWESINMRGIPARTYLKEKAYRDAIPEFKAALADIGKKQGWTLKELQARFSNELWDYIIYQ